MSEPSACNNELVQPENIEIDAWRYLDTAKFVSLLLFRALPLIRIDRFDDKFEGLYTRRLPSELAEIVKANGMDPSVITEQINSMTRSAEESRRYVFASCWCLQDHESEAMWRIYCKGGDGIAIVLPYNKLCNSVSNTPKTYSGSVKYIDFDNQLIRQANPVKRAMYKRREFAHEHEARVLHYDPGLRDRQEPLPEAILLPWDAAKLVERIVISPYAPAWYFDSVCEFVKRISPNLVDRIKRSSMNAY